MSVRRQPPSPDSLPPYMDGDGQTVAGWAAGTFLAAGATAKATLEYAAEPIKPGA